LPGKLTQRKTKSLLALSASVSALINESTWKYLRRWIDTYDVVILSCKEFAQQMKPPQRVIMPAIDPIRNRAMRWDTRHVRLFVRIFS
jgi:hypothetical protein